MRINNRRIPINHKHRDFNSVQAERFKLEDFKDLTHSVDLSAFSQIKKSKQYLRKTKPIYTQTTEHPPNFTSLNKLTYLRCQLDSPFRAFIDPERTPIKYQKVMSRSKKQDEWIIHLKASQREYQNYKKDLEIFDKVRSRLKILDNIKKERKKLLDRFIGK